MARILGVTMRFLSKVNLSMYTKKLFALLAFALLFPRSYAQTAPTPSSDAPPAQQTDRTTIISNADEVTLDLVVHDKKNKPVVDLSRKTSQSQTAVLL